MANNLLSTVQLIEKANTVLSNHATELNKSAVQMEALNKQYSKLPSEYIKALKDNAQAEKALNQAKQANIKTEKDLADLRAKEARSITAQNNAKKSEISLEQKKIIAKERSIRIAKREEAQQNKLNSAWLRFNTTLNQAERRYRDLAVTQGRNNKQTIRARKEVLKLRKEHDKINKSIGVWGKNVGNYATGLQNIAGALGWAGVTFAMANGLKSTFETIKAYDVLLRALGQVTESQAQFTSELVYLKTISEDYGLNLRQTTDDYVKFLASAKETTLTLNQQRSIFKSVAKSSASLGLSAEDTSGTLRALNQIMSKGKVQAEELRGQLGDRIPGAFQIMAKALNVTTQELDEMLKKGEVLADEVLPKFAKEMERSFGIENTKRIETLNGAINRLSNAWDEFIIGIDNGDGVISRFVKGSLDTLTKMINALGVASSGVSETERESSFITMFDKLKQSGVGVDEARKQLSNYRNAISKTEKKVKEANIFQSTFGDIAAQKRSLGFLRGQADAYREYIKFLKTSSEEQDKKIIITNKDTKSIKENTKAIKDNFGYLEGTIPYYEEVLRGLKEQQTQLSRTTEEWYAYQRQIDTFTGSLDALKRSLKGDYTDLEGTEAANTMIDNLVSNFSLENGAKEEVESNWKDTFQTVTDLSRRAFGIMSEISDAHFQKQYSDLEKQKETALLFAGESATARAEIEEQYEERRRKIQQKEANQKKTQAIFDITLDTASAVIRALPNIPLSIAVGALGAAQLAFVASRQVPQYWEGGEVGSRQDIIVNDDPFGKKGSNFKEVIQEPSGKLHFPTGKNVKMNVPKGSYVHPTYDAFIKSLDSELIGNNIMPVGQSNIMPMVINQGLTKSEIMDVMSSHANKLERVIKGQHGIDIKIDENGISKYVTKKGVTTKIMNSRYSGRGRSV